MTSKERFAVLAIFVSVLGFAFVTALKPVMSDYVATYRPIARYGIQTEVINKKSVYYSSKEEGYSKIVEMLSEVLEIGKDDILLSLQGGSKPSELLMSSGIFLSDLSEEYSFDIVGDELVKFRA
jgi:hypothetical protein